MAEKTRPDDFIDGFVITKWRETSTGEKKYEVENTPLTKREYFAGLAMQGICANGARNQGHSPDSDYAKQAVEMADALINALNAETEKPEGLNK